MKVNLSKYDGFPDNACLTLPEMAELIGKSQSMVRKLMEAKKIPASHNANSAKPGHLVYSRNIVRHVWKLGTLRNWQNQLNGQKYE